MWTLQPRSLSRSCPCPGSVQCERHYKWHTSTKYPFILKLDWYVYDISWSSSDFNGSVTCANDRRPEHCTTLQRLVIQDRGGIYGEERWGNYSLRNLLLFIKIISWTSTLRLFQCDIHVEATEFYRWTRDPLLKQRDGNVPGYNIVSAKFYWGEGVLRSNFQRSVLFGGGGGEITKKFQKVK